MFVRGLGPRQRGHKTIAEQRDKRDKLFGPTAPQKHGSEGWPPLKDPLFATSLTAQTTTHVRVGHTCWVVGQMYMYFGQVEKNEA